MLSPLSTIAVGTPVGPVIATCRLNVEAQRWMKKRFSCCWRSAKVCVQPRENSPGVVVGGDFQPGPWFAAHTRWAPRLMTRGQTWHSRRRKASDSHIRASRRPNSRESRTSVTHPVGRQRPAWLATRASKER